MTIESFLVELRQLPPEYQMLPMLGPPFRQIRIAVAGHPHRLCPIDAVWHARQGHFCISTDQASLLLGLAPAVRDQIMDAADNYRPEGLASSIRRSLEYRNNGR